MVLPILGNSHFSATQIKSHLTPLFFFSCTTFNGWGNLVSFSKCVKNLSVSHHFYCYCQATVFFCLFVFCSNTNSLLRSLPASVFIFLQSLLIKATRVSLWTSGSGEAFLSPKCSSAFTSYLEKRQNPGYDFKSVPGLATPCLSAPASGLYTYYSVCSDCPLPGVCVAHFSFVSLLVNFLKFCLTRLTHITSTTPNTSQFISYSIYYYLTHI